MAGFRTGAARESMKPTPRLHREQSEKVLLPKGMIAKSSWERRTFKTAFKGK